MEAKVKRMENGSLVSTDQNSARVRKAIKNRESELTKRLDRLEQQMEKQYDLSLSILDIVHNISTDLKKENN